MADDGDNRRGDWVPASSDDVHPHATDAFARAYQATGERVTGQISLAALEAAPVGPGDRVLDVGAGPGALTLDAARAGAEVTAIDNAGGMVRLLEARIAAEPDRSVRDRTTVEEMDGQALEFDDASFDAAFSIVGVSTFGDWRGGLAELARVTRTGGRAAVATWQRPPGGGPFVVMGQALRALNPDAPAPAPPDGFVVLSDPDRFGAELTAAGFHDVRVSVVDAVWEGPAGPAYLEELRELLPYMGPYAALDAEARDAVDAEVLRIVDDQADGDRVSFASPALLAVGIRD